jgi:acetyltransferase-like isoleucine patch superfamily enzyme
MDMDLKLPDFAEAGGDEEDSILFSRLRKLFKVLMREKRKKHDRVLSLPDYLLDRWEKAEFAGFGEGSSVYDSCLVLGDVRVGKDSWIGPYTILDGSGGGLTIGDGCSVSAGVHIYTHDTVGRVIDGDKISLAPVAIGNHVYIGPNAVIAKGVTIGDYVVIGANSLVNRDIPTGVKAFGTPARIIGPSRKNE